MSARRCAPIGGAVLLAACAAALAADNFNYLGTVSTTPGPSAGPSSASASAQFNTFNGLFTGLSQSGITAVLPQYNGTQPASFAVNLRGIPVTASFPNQGATGNGALLTFSMPSLGINQAFQGANRDASIQLLKDFLKQGDAASRIQREFARSSPFDPIAGNPASLQARLVAHDYDSAFTAFATNIVEPPRPVALAMASDPMVDVAQAGPGGIVPAPNVFHPMPGLGFQYGNYHDQGLTAQSFSLPLSLTFRSDLDPRRQIAVSMPLSVSNVGGATSYSAALGASLRLPLTTQWALSGAINYGLAGSGDLASAGQMASAALTSSYLIRTAPVDISIGNMVGYYRTLSTTVDGISVDPKIANTVFRNGVLVSQRVDWFGGGLSMEYSFVNTFYTGTDLYLNSYNELRVALGSNRRADSVRSFIQAGTGYLFSSKTHGWSLDVDYWF
jgi:hypothetical protein